MGYHGAPNEDTYHRTVALGAKGHGCISIYNRRKVGGLPVGCYFVHDVDWMDTTGIGWKYIAVCDHGSYIGADDRKAVIDLAKMSYKFCSECSDIYVKTMNGGVESE